MSTFTCWIKLDDGTRCGAMVQLTRKSYLALDEDTGQVIRSGPSPSWSAYCENDHSLGEDYDSPSDVRKHIKLYGGEQK